MQFGKQVLSHPLFVAAARSEFVPVAIYNNKKGRDAEILARFEEPAWNNPVVRFLDGKSQDLIPRKTGVYRLAALTERMTAALRAAHRAVPRWLGLLATEAAPHHAKAIFWTHCFWQGEVILGGLDGVARTRPVFVERREAVQVVYDASTLSAGRLAAVAKKNGFRRAPAGLEPRPAPPRDNKYHLRRSRYKKLALTEAQQCRVNAAIATKRPALPWLTPAQRDKLRHAKK